MDNVRPNALAIIQKNGKLLAQRGVDSITGQLFFRLLGGGIEFSELSQDTIKREILEELGATITNEKFICVIENIFDFNGKSNHEITFLYRGDLLEEDLYNKEKVEIIDKIDKYAEWIPISEVKNGNIKLFPKETVNYL